MQTGKRGGLGRTIHGRHDEADLGGVGGTSEVSVDLFDLVLVQRDETVQDVVAGRGIVRSTFGKIRSLLTSPFGSNLVQLAFIVREIVLHRADRELLLKAVDLVQEQDDGGVDEPSRITDGVEQSQSLLHSVDRLVLEEKLIVLGYGNEEEYGCDILKAVNPLLPFGALASHIEHAVRELTDDEGRLGDAGRLDA